MDLKDFCFLRINRAEWRDVFRIAMLDKRVFCQLFLTALSVLKGAGDVSFVKLEKQVFVKDLRIALQNLNDFKISKYKRQIEVVYAESYGEMLKVISYFGQKMDLSVDDFTMALSSEDF